MSDQPTEQQKRQTLFWDFIGALIVGGGYLLYRYLAS